MEERASGIVLRTRPLTESSLIVQWITPEQGRITTIAKGARRPKSPFSGKLDLCYAADFSFMRSRRSELHTLREVSLRETHAALRQDLERLNAAAYLTVLLEQGTERETSIPEFYHLLVDGLAFLSMHQPDYAFLFAVEARFLHLSGEAPASDGLPGGAADVFAQLIGKPFEALEISPSLKRAVSGALRRGIGITLGKLPAQRERLLRSLGG